MTLYGAMNYGSAPKITALRRKLQRSPLLPRWVIPYKLMVGPSDEDFRDFCNREYFWQQQQRYN